MGALNEGFYSSRCGNSKMEPHARKNESLVHRPHPGQCGPAPLHSRPRPRCWARSLTASLEGPWVPWWGWPPHIPAVCREEAALLPHRDSALPAPAGREGTFPVHTKVSLAAGAQTRAQPLPLLPMEPALGPGVQVTSQGGALGSQGEVGHSACLCGECACAWSSWPMVCV